ncbi:DUF4331 family protein [Tundrisphaera lichenicola]|uniref:DUF4331 family protein n=1 Tax=Tundrisphaera lichenicola TaxID=2029860 RepID=UPI003EBBA725
MASLLFALPTRAADHRDGPKITDRNGDLGALDLNDLYVFQSPSNKDNTVFIMTMSPGAGIVGPSFFFPGAVYELHISNDGNDLDLTEQVFRIVFTGPNNTGRQGYTVTLLNDKFETRVLAQGVTNSKNPVSLRGGGKVTAGIFDDPFFFDANAVARVNRELTLSSMGIPLPDVPEGANPARWLFPPNFPNNFFGGFNTLAIVFEVPRFRVQSSMGNPNIAVWERVVANAGDGRGFAQYDRTAIPAINTVVVPLSRTINREVLPNGLQDQFNFLYPSDDVNLRPVASHRLQTVFGLPEATATSLVNLLLPDLSHFDTTSTDGFPNGRRLKDDVVDIELGLLTNGAVTSDRVVNDSYFRSSFPYLGTPNPVTAVLRQSQTQIRKHMSSGSN